MWIVFAVIVAALILFSFARARVRQRSAARRGEVWEGVVTDLSRGSADGQNMFHRVEMQLPSGETKELRIPGKLWKSLSVGDAVIKSAGSPDPVKKSA